jgi:molecular chaperone DnaK (HSP70)
MQGCTKRRCDATGAPPAQRGEPCFEVLFSIDANKRLLITVRDLRTMRLVMEDYPVVKLT